MADDRHAEVTTSTGAPIAEQQALTAGPRGPVLMQDVELLQQMQKFNRERIPERDVRGFALKFYTEDGNWDMVGNHTPVFFVRDPYKFANFIHTQKRHPKSNVRDMDMQWDFWSMCPESLHQVTILFSDRGIPKTLRHMNGYGSHTYSLIKDEGERMAEKLGLEIDAIVGEPVLAE